MPSNRLEITGKVQTVLGVIDADDLGITLPHEHLLVDLSVYFTEPEEARFKRLAHEPVSFENHSWIQHHTYNSLDNLRLLDEEEIIGELMPFKNEGGSTVVSLSNVGLARDPLGLVNISRATGLNVVMGSGYYISQSQGPEYERKTKEEIAEEINADIEVGVDNTGIRAGIIGELGCTWPLKESERKVLLAGVIAQKRTGATINVHQVSAGPNDAMEIIKILDDAGADLSRVVIDHIDLTVLPLSYRLELAKTGCYLEYDIFGYPTFAPPSPFGGGSVIRNRPCDRERIEQITELIDAGYLNQILISQDICMKHLMLRYGGHGFAHILCNIVPQMLVRGITREQIHTMMVENPKHVLSFA